MNCPTCGGNVITNWCRECQDVVKITTPAEAAAALEAIRDWVRCEACQCFSTSNDEITGMCSTDIENETDSITLQPIYEILLFTDFGCKFWRPREGK